jgi:hypothetical protein
MARLEGHGCVVIRRGGHGRSGPGGLPCPPPGGRLLRPTSPCSDLLQSNTASFSEEP